MMTLKVLDKLRAQMFMDETQNPSFGPLLVHKVLLTVVLVPNAQTYFDGVVQLSLMSRVVCREFGSRDQWTLLVGMTQAT